MRYFHAQMKKGEIPKATVEKWDKESKGKMAKKPEYIKNGKQGPG